MSANLFSAAGFGRLMPGRPIIGSVIIPPAGSHIDRSNRRARTFAPPFSSVRSLLKEAGQPERKLSQVALEYEAKIKRKPEKEIRRQMGDLLGAMFEPIQNGLVNRDPIGEEESNAHKFISIAIKFPCSREEFTELAKFIIVRLQKKTKLSPKEKEYYEKWKFIITDPYVKNILARRKTTSFFNSEEGGRVTPNNGYVSDLYQDLCYYWTENPSVEGLYIKAAGYAFAVAEWSMRGGKIVAVPSAEACGIIPGVLKAMQECFVYSKEELFTPEHVTEALFTAGLIGLFFNDRARMGIGPASAMAAAAATELLGGDPGDIIHAVAFALEGIRDLPGTPVRNAFGAVVALTAATFATNKYKSHFYPDAVL